MRTTVNHVCAILACVSHIVLADIFIYFVDDSHNFPAIKDMPSTFGEPIANEGIQGKLWLADPPDGCGPMQPPPTIHNSVRNWVALISRKNCSFEEKVRQAQNAHYDIVIVHNVDSDDLEPMSANNKTGISIPSVFIGQYDGNYLKELLSSNEKKNEFYLILTPEAPFNINTHLLLPFAIVVGICFIVMIVFMVVKCIKDRRRARRHRLPASALNKMLLHKFVKGDPYETCAICLDDYVEGEKLRVLPCAHAYHSKCIDPWLTNNRRVCPVCKRKVFAQDEEPCPSDSDTDNENDTTPLINPNTQAQNAGGGTFNVEHEQRPASAAAARSSMLSRREFTTLLNFIRDHQILGTECPSINDESSVEVSSGSYDSTATEPNGAERTGEEPNQACLSTEEIHVHTRPENANGPDSDVVI